MSFRSCLPISSDIESHFEDFLSVCASATSSTLSKYSIFHCQTFKVLLCSSHSVAPDSLSDTDKYFDIGRRPSFQLCIVDSGKILAALVGWNKCVCFCVTLYSRNCLNLSDMKFVIGPREGRQAGGDGALASAHSLSQSDSQRVVDIYQRNVRDSTQNAIY